MTDKLTPDLNEREVRAITEGLEKINAACIKTEKKLTGKIPSLKAGGADVGTLTDAMMIFHLASATCALEKFVGVSLLRQLYIGRGFKTQRDVQNYIETCLTQLLEHWRNLYFEGGAVVKVKREEKGETTFKPVISPQIWPDFFDKDAKILASLIFDKTEANLREEEDV